MGKYLKLSLAFSLSRGGLFLLENNCIHRDCNANANCSHHGQRRLKSLVLHPVKVVHVLGVDVVRLIVGVRSHPSQACGWRGGRLCASGDEAEAREGTAVERHRRRLLLLQWSPPGSRCAVTSGFFVFFERRRNVR